MPGAPVLHPTNPDGPGAGRRRGWGRGGGGGGGGGVGGGGRGGGDRGGGWWGGWGRGAGRRPGGWRPRGVLVVVAAALVGVMAVGVSAVLIGQRGTTAGYDEGAAAVGTSAASPVAPSSPMETAPGPAAS